MKRLELHYRLQVYHTVQILDTVYNKSYSFIYIFVCIYMLAIAGQTAGPNGLKFVEGTHVINTE